MKSGKCQRNIRKQKRASMKGGETPGNGKESPMFEEEP